MINYVLPSIVVLSNFRATSYNSILTIYQFITTSVVEFSINVQLQNTINQNVSYLIEIMKIIILHSTVNISCIN